MPQWLSAGLSSIVAVDADGKLSMAGNIHSNTQSVEEVKAKVTEWKELVQAFNDGTSPIALCADGTVKYTLPNIYRATDLVKTPCVLGNGSNWKNVTYLEYQGAHLAGLHANGTVSAVGINENGECEVSEWTDIRKISLSYNFTVGLKNDGTVVIAGSKCLQDDSYKEWKNVIDIEASIVGVAGLHENGKVSVVYTSSKSDYLNQIKSWKDVVRVVSGSNNNFYGITKDGKLLSCKHYEGDKEYLFCSALDNVVDVKEHNGLTILHGDGRVSEFNVHHDTSNWENVVYIHAESDYALGITMQGQILVAGQCRYGNLDLQDLKKWKVFDHVNTAYDERDARLKQGIKKQLDMMKEELERAKQELSELKGLFKGKQRKELEMKIRDLEEYFN